MIEGAVKLDPMVAVVKGVAGCEGSGMASSVTVLRELVAARENGWMRSVRKREKLKPMVDSRPY